MIEFANTLPDDDPFDRFFGYANVGGVYKNIIFGAAGRLCDFGPTTTANLVVGYRIPFADHRTIEVYGKVSAITGDCRDKCAP